MDTYRSPTAQRAYRKPGTLSAFGQSQYEKWVPPKSCESSSLRLEPRGKKGFEIRRHIRVEDSATASGCLGHNRRYRSAALFVRTVGLYAQCLVRRRWRSRQKNATERTIGRQNRELATWIAPVLARTE
jgi:hypothetical protein